MSPSLTDQTISYNYISPIPNPASPQGLDNAISIDLQNLLDKLVFEADTVEQPILFQAYNRPNLRYAVAGFYQGEGARLASNCIQEALRQSPRKDCTVIIGGEGPRGAAIRRREAKSSSEEISSVNEPDGWEIR